MKRFVLPAFVSLALLVPIGLAQAQTIFVTTPADFVDFGGSQQVGNLPGPDGLVSMREATIAANNTAGPQTIGFQVPMNLWGGSTTGPVILNVGDPFAVNDAFTTIDGTTQTSFTGNTNPLGAEVSFLAILQDQAQILRGMFEIKSDNNVITGLGNMTGRNYGLDFLPQASGCLVTRCTINAVFAAIRVQGDGNTIGSTVPLEGNMLSSLSDGLRIQSLGDDPASNNVVIGNHLTGEFNGVQIVGKATGNRIGGVLAGEANVIAGAGYLQEDGTPDGAQVRIESDAFANLVVGNFIGTNAAGTNVVENVGDVGIEIYGDANEIKGNVIGGITGLAGFLSVQAGIDLREGAVGNVIQGNFIGLDKGGSIRIPNHIGIHIAAFDASLPQPGDNVIGGLVSGQGNEIAFNEVGGVIVEGDTLGNRISGNSIHDNAESGGIGIDLGGDGVTPNDPGDGDRGPNGTMNKPVISSVVAGTSGTTLIGKLDTPDPSSATIEVFGNPTPGQKDTVEAQVLLALATPDAAGNWNATILANLTGFAMSATATDGAGNTSEISEGEIVTVSPWQSLGFALPGTNGAPFLVGAGPLTPGEDVALLLTNGLPNTTGWWVLSGSTLFAPALGGIMVPQVQFLQFFEMGGDGTAELVGAWPGVPSGTTIVVQNWFLDPAGPVGWAASNGVIGTSP